MIPSYTVSKCSESLIYGIGAQLILYILCPSCESNHSYMVSVCNKSFIYGVRIHQILHIWTVYVANPSSSVSVCIESFIYSVCLCVCKEFLKYGVCIQLILQIRCLMQRILHIRCLYATNPS